MAMVAKSSAFDSIATAINWIKDMNLRQLRHLQQQMGVSAKTTLPRIQECQVDQLSRRSGL